MNANEQQVEQIEISIRDAKERIEMMNALLRLTKNKDYIKVIDKGYLEKEAIRLTLLRADTNFKTDIDQEQLLKAIDSIGQFYQYCSALVQLGRTAERAIAADENTREELLAEAV